MTLSAHSLKVAPIVRSIRVILQDGIYFYVEKHCAALRKSLMKTAEDLEPCDEHESGTSDSSSENDQSSDEESSCSSDGSSDESSEEES